MKLNYDSEEYHGPRSNLGTEKGPSLGPKKYKHCHMDQIHRNIQIDPISESTHNGPQKIKESLYKSNDDQGDERAMLNKNLDDLCI